VLDDETVREIEALRRAGASIRRIVTALRLSRNTVRAYIRRGGPARRRAPPEWFARAVELFEERCKGNASAVARVLRTQGVAVSTRTVQRVLRAARSRPGPPTPADGFDRAPPGVPEGTRARPISAARPLQEQEEGP
jgi:transposase